MVDETLDARQFYTTYWYIFMVYSYQAFAYIHTHDYELRSTNNHRRISGSSVWTVEDRHERQVSASAEHVAQVNERVMKPICRAVDPIAGHVSKALVRNEAERIR